MAVSVVYYALSLLLLSKFAHPYGNAGKEESNDPGNKLYTDCSPNDKFLKFSDVKITPMPMIRGKAYHIYGTLKIKQKIEWGLFHLMVTHPLINNISVTIVDEKLNFCDFCVEALKLYCPLQPGTYYMNDTNYVPSIFWTGPYNGKATVYNVKNELMFCGEYKMDIK